MNFSIPVGLPINEATRLLCYLKAKHPSGYLFKSQIKKLYRYFGRDSRTFRKHLKSLLNDGLIGEDKKAYYLRSWEFIIKKTKINLQAFKVSVDEISRKDFFEAKQLASKITGIRKAVRRRARVSERGFTNQIAASTGLLSKLCQLSAGKISELKKVALGYDLIKIEKSFEVLCEGSKQHANAFRRELPGIFLKNGQLMRRKEDKISSKVNTYCIRNRRSKT